MTSVRAKDRPHRLPLGRYGGWLPDRPSHKDWRLSNKLGPAPASAPESVHLDPATYPTIRDQGQQGSCTGHGTRNALAQRLLARDHAFWSRYDLSPAAAYYNARALEGSVREDSGAYIRDVVEGAAKFGVARESDCPYSDSKLVTSLTKAAQISAKWHQALHYYRCDEQGASTETTVTNIIRALADGMPVVFGFTCFSNLGEADADGRIPMPSPRDREDGGHCMCIYEANVSSRLFIGPNSWGTNWGGVGKDGQRGYFALPFDYFLQGLADDAWAVDHE
jgi:C1A family cysteine protease